MSNLTIQSTPKTYLEQHPLGTGQVSVNEEGIVVGNSGDINTCLFEGSLNTKLGVQNLDEAKTLLDVVPVLPMPQPGGVSFVTNRSGSIDLYITLCTASTGEQVGGNIIVNWGDGSAIATYTIASTGFTTCAKAASYTTSEQKIVMITCATATHSLLSFIPLFTLGIGRNVLSIDGRNCPKMASLYLDNNPGLKAILGFDQLQILSVTNCTSLKSIPKLKNVRTVTCYGCPQLTNPSTWFDSSVVDPWPKCNKFDLSQIGPPFGGVGFGSTYVFMNNFYTLLHDWGLDSAIAGTSRASVGNSGYADSDKTIATNKDWTVT